MTNLMVAANIKTNDNLLALSLLPATGFCNIASLFATIAKRTKAEPTIWNDVSLNNNNASIAIKMPHRF